MMDESELQRRKSMTFEQAEGFEELPSQLSFGEITDEMRARLWRVVYDSLVGSMRAVPRRPGYYLIGGPWHDILKDWHLDVLHKFADEFNEEFDSWVTALKGLFADLEYHYVLGFLQYVMRSQNPPRDFAADVERALIASRAAYRVIDGDTIAPIASEEEGATLGSALENLRGTTFKGPRVHLKEAASATSAGDWAGSVRESVHAVEAVVRLVGKSNSVDDALKKLANKGHINRNMSAGLVRLYAYTSDEKGIRHPLLADGDANVDEADALYMLGASASFITYLIGKARAVGLLEG